jgi:hypothetical protein
MSLFSAKFTARPFVGPNFLIIFLNFRHGKWQTANLRLDESRQNASASERGFYILKFNFDIFRGFRVRRHG